MINLIRIQAEHRRWVDRNFPNESLSQATLGVAEESGELAHAVLKMEQGIRGTEAEHRAEAKDAIGDICIYAMSVCDHLGLNFEECINTTWQEVAARDWQANPDDGVAHGPDKEVDDRNEAAKATENDADLW